MALFSCPAVASPVLWRLGSVPQWLLDQLSRTGVAARWRRARELVRAATLTVDALQTRMGHPPAYLLKDLRLGCAHPAHLIEGEDLVLASVKNDLASPIDGS